MTFDELWRRNLPGMDPGISPIDNQAEASFSCDPAFGESAFEDLDEAEMNRFLECLERTLIIDDPRLSAEHEASNLSRRRLCRIESEFLNNTNP